LGCLAALDHTVSVDALRQAVRESVPKGTEELNLKAFERGYEHGQKLLQPVSPSSPSSAEIRN
jgi:2-oxoglutarate ferredoxin oxidoreductase subunit gamma